MVETLMAYKVIANVGQEGRCIGQNSIEVLTADVLFSKGIPVPARGVMKLENEVEYCRRLWGHLSENDSRAKPSSTWKLAIT